MNRVVVTGLGVVSPIGSTREKFWSGLVEARSGIGPITIVPTERLNTRIAAQVLDYDPAEHFDSKRLDMLDRFAQFAVVAARAAVKDAQLAITDEIALQAATIVGNGAGGMNTLDESFCRLYGQNAAPVHPLTIPRWMMSAACSHVSMDLGLKGPTLPSHPPALPARMRLARRSRWLGWDRPRSRSPAELKPALPAARLKSGRR
jgi:nodulation protein E